MSTLPFKGRGDPRQPVREDFDSIAEQFLKTSRLTGDPEDQLVVEALREADRQEELYRNSGAQPNVKSQMSERRASIIFHAAKLVESRMARRDRMTLARIAANILMVFRDTLIEEKFEPAQVNHIVSTVGMKIAESQTA